MTKMSSLPTSQEINSANYLLCVLSELTDQIGACTIDSLKRACSSRVFGGMPFNFKYIVELCMQMEFISRGNGNLSLTETGKEFIALNHKKTYELSKSQENYILENLIFEGIWKSNCRGFFSVFSPNYKSLNFELTIKESPLPQRFAAIFQLLRRLGVVETNSEIVFVVPQYIRHVRDILTSKGISQEKLNSILDADAELGARAEEVVLEFERKRLIQLERIPEAQLVQRISQLDAGAGYDIVSFDGNIASLTHNRFIEVKASRQGSVRFYWSLNEYEKAKELGDQYWIYFVGNFEGNKRSAIKPIMIQNPVRRIEELSEFSIRATKYIVEKIPGS